MTISAGTDEAVQYPAGQRPRVEALDALAAVTTAEVAAGAVREDSDDTIRDAMAEAETVLNDRAGDSPYFSADAYNHAADHGRRHRPAAVYDAENPGTTFSDGADFHAAYLAYTQAFTALQTECGS